MKRSAFALSTRALLAALVLATATTTVQANASPADWWVYVHNDNVSDIKELLTKGSDPNVRFTNGQPALMRAVVDGAWGVFDVLAADPRTDINATNPANETALMYLAVAGQTERARKLIARGAEVNRLGWTPLHYAASKAHIDVAKLLIANKAMINAPSSEGTTPIMMAAFSGRMPMVQLLLDAGADITTRNVKGQNASDWAAMAKRNDLSAQLVPIIAKAEQQRSAQRAGAGKTAGSVSSGAAVAPIAPSPVPQASPPAANATPAPGATDQEQSVQGVSGIKLNSYD